MKTKHQILIDRLFVKPMVFIFNFIVRLLGKVANIDHNLNKNFKVIAVCKFKGMGSIIQSTPMLNALREKYPQAEIIYISTAGNRNILEKISTIDTIITVNDSSLWKTLTSTIKAISTLRKKRIEIYFDIEIYSNYSTLFTLFTLAKNRVGFYLTSSSFKKGIYTHMMFFNAKVPISKTYLQMSAIIDCNIEKDELYHFEYSHSQANENYPYLVINPNSSDLRIERRWDKDNFIKLIKAIVSKYNFYKIYLIGNKAEKEYTDNIAELVNNERVISIAGKTTIDELVNLIGNAKLMVSNDTGPMHIAFSTNTPIVCLFGPCSPDQYGGFSQNVYMLYKRTYCSPCVHDFINPPCYGDNVCMKLILVSDVINVVEKFLNTNKFETNTITNDIAYKFENKTIGIISRP